MSALPSGWILSNLGVVVNYGLTEKVEPSEIRDDEWILELEDIEKNTSRLLRRVEFGERKSKSTKNRFLAGDVLYGKLRPNLNKVIIADEPGVSTTEILPLRCPGGVEPKYIFYALKRPEFIEYVTHVNHGIDMPRLGTEAGKKATLPLAPANEQQRIVAKLDSLLAHSTRACHELDLVPKLIERYKQAILAKAFSGDLTAHWRRTRQYKTTEPPDILTALNLENKTKRTIASLTPQQEELMWEAPDGWNWVQVGDVGFVTKLAGFEYTKFVKYDASGDLRVIKAENAGPNGFRKTDYSKVRSETISGLTRSRLKGNELLVVFVGAGVGNVAIVPTDDQYFLGPNIAMVRPINSLRVRYLELFFRAERGKRLLLSTSKAVAQPSLSMGAIRSTPLLMPPPDEQQEIIRQLELAFAWLENIATEHARAERLLPKLDQAILAKAFRGELVPQDPNEEPASALLERIRIERETQSVPRRRRTRAA